MSGPAPLTECWCYNQLKVTQFNYTWVIDNFSFRYEMKVDRLRSSTFCSGGSNSPKWFLEMYPRGIGETSSGCISLFLHLDSGDESEILTKFEISILNAKKEKSRETENRKTEHRFIPEENDWGWKNYIRRERLFDEGNELLPDDKLTIFCELSVFEDSVDISGQSSSVSFKVPECTLADELGDLLESQQFSDVTLYANGREFKAHKNILAARSPVFEAMFSHDMEEKKQNKVEIKDIEHDVLYEILKFIYTGKVSNLEKMAVGLLSAADKYSLERLKILCEEALSLNLKVDNVAEMLMLADLHSANDLKKQSIEFIISHANDVMGTNGWKELIQRHSYLVADTFHAVIKQIPQVGPIRKRRKKRGKSSQSSS